MVLVAALTGVAPVAAGANVLPPLPPLSPLPSVTWEPKGPVSSVERSGNVLFMAGDFRYVGPPNTQFGAVLSATTAEAPLGLPRVVGEVRAALSDGADGWFIGGAFVKVGGLTCVGVAHLRADLSVDPAFCGSLEPSAGQSQAVVNALARSATRLYVGGRFARIHGVVRSNLAALNLTTGAVDPFAAGPITWTETIPGSTSCQRDCTPAVLSLAVSDSLFVAGNFTAVGNSERWGIAALEPTTGALRSSWHPKPSAFDHGQQTPAQQGDEFEFQVPVRALALGGGRLYAGGEFEHVNGGAQESAPRREGIVALDPASGAVVTAFAAGIPPSGVASGTVRSLATLGSTVFVGGFFSAVRSGKDTVARANLAAISANGAVLAWKPDPDSAVESLAPAGAAILVGGVFSSIAGVPRDGLAAIVAPSVAPAGVASNWAPSVHLDPGFGQRIVRAVAAAGTSAYVGGNFQAAGGVRRASLAAIDLVSGRPTAWAPTVSGPAGLSTVTAMARVGTTLYLAGAFDGINGAPRAGLAAVSTDTGDVLPWAPADVAPGTSRVQALAATSTAVYVGGDFQLAAGSPFELAGALDPATGAPLPWNPQLSGSFLSSGRFVWDIVPTGATVYLAGSFAATAGLPRLGLAAVDAVSGTPTAFDAGITAGTTPPRDLALRPLSATTSRLYLVGGFSTVDGQGRNGAAAVDGGSGAITSWVAGSGLQSAILLSGPDVLTVQSGTIRNFSPDPPGAPGTLAITAQGGFVGGLAAGPDASVIVFGGFTIIGGRDQRGVAVFARGDPVSVGQSSAVVAKRDRWSAPVRCHRRAAKRCTVVAVLRETATRRRAVIGRVTLTIPAGRAKRAVFLLTTHGLALLRQRPRLPVVVEVVSTDANGRVTVGTRPFTLTRP